MLVALVVIVALSAVALLGPGSARGPVGAVSGPAPAKAEGSLGEGLAGALEIWWEVVMEIYGGGGGGALEKCSPACAA
jgi:hypothetical protein